MLLLAVPSALLHLLAKQPLHEPAHILVVGPSRSGKGTGFVLPNGYLWQGSAVFFDPKRENFEALANHRAAKGNKVFMFSPGSNDTHRYNPLDFIRADRGDRTTDIQNMAAILVPEVTESENSIWQATAQQVIAGAISYVNESVHYKGHRTLGEVTSFFNSGANLQAMMTLIKDREPYLSRFTVESFNTYIALSERAAASALLDIQKALRPFRNERVVAATSVTDMDLRALKRRPISIYLAPNVTDITLLRPLLALFVQQTLDTLMLEHAARSVPVYFLLDEFRQLKKMTEITTKLPYVAGYNVKMAFVIQDLKNLDEIYGETARHSLLGNCGYQLVLGANDQATADYASRALGKRTARYKSESRTIELFGLPRRTKVEQIRERDLMMPQEIRQMPADKMILIVQGQKPIFGDKLRFFETQPFKSAVAYSYAKVPDVPPIEYLPERPVPATTEAYTGEIASGDEEPAPTGVGDARAASPRELPLGRRVGTAVKSRVRTPRALPGDQVHADTTAVAPRRLTTGTAGSLSSRARNERNTASTISERVKHAEGRLKPTAEKLKHIVARKVGATTSASPQRRRSYLEIFDATIPDPLDIGLATE